MPRIVKAGAEIVLHYTTEKVYGKYEMGEIIHSQEMVKLSDTIEIKKGWRPEGYKNGNEYREDTLVGCACQAAFEAGFDACIEAMEREK